MSRHLNDHEMASAAAGFQLDSEPLAHLDGCISCRRSVTLFLDQVEDRRKAMEEETPDWDVQLEQILGGLSNEMIQPTSKRRRWFGPLLAAAATITIAIGTSLIVQKESSQSISTPMPDIKIEEILAQTESLLAEEEIPGLDILDEVSEDDLAVIFEAQNS